MSVQVVLRKRSTQESFWVEVYTKGQLVGQFPIECAKCGVRILKHLPELIEDCIRREGIEESSTAGIVWCGLKGRKCAPVPACNEYDTTGGCTFAILRLSVEEAD